MNLDEDKIDYELLDMLDLSDLIIEHYCEEPPDRRKKEYKEWVQHYNELVDIYNTKAKTKIFNKIR